MSTPALPPPLPQARFALTPAQIEAFQADGAVVLRQLLQGQELELLRAGIEHNLAHPSLRAKVASSRDDPGFFCEDFCCWQDNPHYRRFIFESALGEVGARLMHSASARLYHDHMLTKEPGTRARTPWHQDQPYYNVERAAELQLLDPGRPGGSRHHARVHRRLAPRALADAALLHGPPGEVVPAGQPRRAAGHRCRTRRAGPILGWPLAARAMRCVSTC